MIAKKIAAMTVFMAAMLLSVTARAASPAVIELFTSEGCSSCPPAEAYLGEVAQRPNVVALTFHVDYWDHLGWKDTFSARYATARQRAYATTLHRSSVYTPQAIVNGRFDFVGSDRRAIDAILAPPQEGVSVTILRDEGRLQIDLPQLKSGDSCDVLLLPFIRAATSRIGRGENAGRTIRESNVVREIRHLGTWDGHEARYAVSVDSLPIEATDVAVIVQTAGTSAILGAATRTIR